MARGFRFGLAVGSSYYDANVVMVNKLGAGLGVADVWMDGHVDGNPLMGKVSYLGEHEYTVALPMSTHPKTQGVRYFLNSLFEAPCATAEGAPSPWTSFTGAPATNGNYTFSVCFGNAGPGIAFDATLSLTLPAGARVVSMTGGTQNGNTIQWNLESLAAGANACMDLTVSFSTPGDYAFGSSLAYGIGVRSLVSSSDTFAVRFGHINLLRYEVPGNATAVALDAQRDVEVIAFSSGMSFPHASSDLAPNSAALVFYNLDGNNGDTLRLAKVGGAISVTF